MPSHWCVVQGCNNTLNLEGGISVHISPKNKTTRQMGKIRENTSSKFHSSKTFYGFLWTFRTRVLRKKPSRRRFSTDTSSGLCSYYLDETKVARALFLEICTKPKEGKHLLLVAISLCVKSILQLHVVVLFYYFQNATLSLILQL